MKNFRVVLLTSIILGGGLLAQAAKDEPFTPANPPAMKPLPDHNTPAYEAAKLFWHGVNLGDYLEAGRWGLKIKVDEFASMKREGFDHVRVPVSWHRYTGMAPDFTLSEEIFSRVDFAVTNTLANRMSVMINIHHFDALDADPTNAAAEFLKIWQQIATHYKHYPPQLSFELDNEPHDQATTALMNPIYAQAIAEIRKTNPHRTLFLEPGNWGSIHELKNLVLPPDDNLIVSVHCYEPFHFTHQGAGWTTADVQQTNIIFPGPPAHPLSMDESLHLQPWVRDWIEKYNTLPADKNPSGPSAFTGQLKYIHDWSAYYGRPVHLGEFGAYIKADDYSRANYYAAFRQAADHEGIGWCIWDWSANFHYWDNKNNAPIPGMREALFKK